MNRSIQHLLIHVSLWVASAAWAADGPDYSRPMTLALHDHGLASFRNGLCAVIVRFQESTMELSFRLKANLSQIALIGASASLILLRCSLGRKIVVRWGCHILGLDSASCFHLGMKKAANISRPCSFDIDLQKLTNSHNLRYVKSYVTKIVIIYSLMTDP